METHRDIRRISDEALKTLRGYAWPGNVRELENALLRAAILARGSIIGPDHLVLGDEAGEAEDLTLDTAMAQHVRVVLERASGDEGEAARLLGITKKELKARLGEEGE